MKETLLPLSQAIVALQKDNAVLYSAIEAWKLHHPEEGELIAETLASLQIQPEILEAVQQKIQFVELAFHRISDPPREIELKSFLEVATLGIRY